MDGWSEGFANKCIEQRSFWRDIYCLAFWYSLPLGINNFNPNLNWLANLHLFRYLCSWAKGKCCSFEFANLFVREFQILQILFAILMMMDTP